MIDWVFCPHAMTTEWTKENFQKLFAAMKSNIPKRYRMFAYSKAQKALDWKKVAFPPFSPEECQEKWGEILQKVNHTYTFSWQKQSHHKVCPAASLELSVISHNYHSITSLGFNVSQKSILTLFIFYTPSVLFITWWQLKGFIIFWCNMHTVASLGAPVQSLKPLQHLYHKFDLSCRYNVQVLVMLSDRSKQYPVYTLNKAATLNNFLLSLRNATII